MKKEIELGLLCAPLTQQLSGLIAADYAEVMEAHNRAINRLAVHLLLTETEVKRARKRLIALIQKRRKLELKATDSKRQKQRTP